MLYSSARVYWKVYYKDGKEIGHSDYLDTFEKLKEQLLLLCMWQRTRDCHIDIDVTFYPSCIFEDTVTILGAI